MGVRVRDDEDSWEDMRHSAPHGGLNESKMSGDGGDGGGGDMRVLTVFGRRGGLSSWVNPTPTSYSPPHLLTIVLRSSREKEGLEKAVMRVVSKKEE